MYDLYMSKIVLAQIDPIAGDVRHNAKLIRDNINKAIEIKADLIVFPELCLFGYPFGDIFVRHKPIIEEQLKELAEIAKLTTSITALVGFVEPNNKQDKKPYYNSVAVMQGGQVVDIVRKRLLPSYSEFNDNRYFEPYDKPSKVIEIKGEKYGIIICEDSYNDKDFFHDNLYHTDPVNELMSQNPKVIINCSSSPSRARKEQLKHRLFSTIAKKYGVHYIYVNQAGYGDNLSFEGASRIYSPKGELTLRAKFYEEDFAVADNFKGVINDMPKGLEKSLKEEKAFTLDYESDLDRTYKSVICAIRGYFRKTGFKKAVLGLSGGLDSSICATLLADALGPENVWGISMPTTITSSESKNDAQKLAENLKIQFIEVPIIEEVSLFKKELNGVFDKIETDKYEKTTTIENIQARIRASILWSVSNEYKQMLPIATSDKSELYIGYATINGDMSGGFAPIADITKTKLFALARYMNKSRKDKNAIPKSVLEKPPGAELKLDKAGKKTVTAEEENMPYEFLDEIIWCTENLNYGYKALLEHKFTYEKRNKFSKEQKKEWIQKFYSKSQAAIYKWHILPPSVIIDSRSINLTEYRHPIISKFNIIH